MAKSTVFSDEYRGKSTVFRIVVACWVGQHATTILNTVDTAPNFTRRGRFYHRKFLAVFCDGIRVLAAVPYPHSETYPPKYQSRGCSFSPIIISTFCRACIEFLTNINLWYVKLSFFKNCIFALGPTVKCWSSVNNESFANFTTFSSIYQYSRYGLC